MPPGSKRCGLLVLLGGWWLAARGEGIIATMVAVNVIYIASVGIAFCALILRRPLSPTQARSVMALGFAASVTARVAAGMRWSGELADGIALAFGLGFSALPLAYQAVRARPKVSKAA
jgi:SSS family solute:Na+ symporter